MTDQEFFDVSATHLLRQADRSIQRIQWANRILCRGAFRGENNLKSAIGIHISDEIYKPEMEINIEQGMYDATINNRMNYNTIEKQVFELLGIKFNNHHHFTYNEIVIWMAQNRRYQLCYALEEIHNKINVDDWPLRLQFLAKTWHLSDIVINEGMTVFRALRNWMKNIQETFA